MRIVSWGHALPGPLQLSVGTTVQLEQTTPGMPALQHELKRRTRSLVVELCDRQGLLWSQIAVLRFFATGG